MLEHTKNFLLPGNEKRETTMAAKKRNVKIFLEESGSRNKKSGMTTLIVH